MSNLEYLQRRKQIYGGGGASENRIAILLALWEKPLALYSVCFVYVVELVRSRANPLASVVSRSVGHGARKNVCMKILMVSMWMR